MRTIIKKLENERNEALTQLEDSKKRLKMSMDNAKVGLVYIRNIIKLENRINSITADIDFYKANY